MEPHGLDDQLCFALYPANNVIVRAYRPLLQAVGLTYPQLVERHRHRLSRRIVKIALTDRGRLMEERAVVAQHQIRCQTKLSTAAVQQLRGSLHDLTDTLEGRTPDPNA